MCAAYVSPGAFQAKPRREHLHQLCATDARGVTRRGRGKLLRHLVLETKRPGHPGPLEINHGLVP